MHVPLMAHITCPFPSLKLQDEYDDDPDFHNDEQEEADGHHSKQSGGGEKVAVKRCQACDWPMESRTRALGTLAQLSQQNRETLALERALSKGAPPPPPKLTVSQHMTTCGWFASSLGVGDSSCVELTGGL